MEPQSFKSNQQFKCKLTCSFHVLLNIKRNTPCAPEIFCLLNLRHVYLQGINTQCCVWVASEPGFWSIDVYMLDRWPLMSALGFWSGKRTPDVGWTCWLGLTLPNSTTCQKYLTRCDRVKQVLFNLAMVTSSCQ